MGDEVENLFRFCFQERWYSWNENKIKAPSEGLIFKAKDGYKEGKGF